MGKRLSIAFEMKATSEPTKVLLKKPIQQIFQNQLKCDYHLKLTSTQQSRCTFAASPSHSPQPDLPPLPTPRDPSGRLRCILIRQTCIFSPLSGPAPVPCYFYLAEKNIFRTTIPSTPSSLVLYKYRSDFSSLPISWMISPLVFARGVFRPFDRVKFPWFSAMEMAENHDASSLRYQELATL